MNLRNQVLFDDGDEVVLSDAAGLPAEIVVADHTGTFTEYQHPLEEHAAAYAGPVNDRIAFVPERAAFAEAYLAAFAERLVWIQGEYRKRRRAFDTLFKHRRWDEGGSFAYRWVRVLQRLDRTDAAALTAAIRACIRSE